MTLSLSALLTPPLRFLQEHSPGEELHPPDGQGEFPEGAAVRVSRAPRTRPGPRTTGPRSAPRFHKYSGDLPRGRAGADRAANAVIATAVSTNLRMFFLPQLLAVVYAIVDGLTLDGINLQ